MMDLEGSVLYRLDPLKAADVYKTVGINYAEVVLVPQVRSAIREITASYDAKALYSSEREQIARETFDLTQKMMGGRGVIVGVRPAAQDRPARHRRQRDPGEVEAGAGIRADEVRPARRSSRRPSASASRRRASRTSRRSWRRGSRAQLLEWKGIEATEKLAMSPNAKVVVVGNPKSGLPIILGGGSN